ncbi:hypothetical protein XENORESO_014642 [Xenotaenia resolanae]|uniref:Uncharacterized protein n=1 Tax=Xenotaenia resolanae TaxID=208358 RepID=A0ABV0WJ14_9TELE
MVVKGDKSKAPLLSSAAIGHYINDLDFAKLLEVIPKVRLFCMYYFSCLYIDHHNRALNAKLANIPLWKLHA